MSQDNAAGLLYNVATRQWHAATRPAIRPGARATLYRDLGKKVASLRHGALARTCAHRHGRGLLRHDREGATTRSRVHQDTAPSALSARGLGGVCAQAMPGCAPGAPNPVLTKCTVFQSLFGPLFMNTVLKIFQKK